MTREPVPLAVPSAGSESRLSRRAFVAGGTAALALGLTGCGWRGGPLKPGIGAIGRLNDWVSEGLFHPTAPAPKYSLLERSASFPNYHISPATPTLEDPGAWRLGVRGLVHRELDLSRPMIEEMARITYTVKHHCVEGWSAIATWTGVPLRVIAELAGVKPAARYVRFDSFDGAYYNGWDMKSAMHPETILAYGFNDRPLGPDHGAPLRLYAPHKLGYKLTKYLTTVTFTAERPKGYWEDRGYPWFGGV